MSSEYQNAPPGKSFFRLVAWFSVVLVAVVTGGIYLHESGYLELAMSRMTATPDRRIPDFSVRVVDDDLAPVGRFEIQLASVSGGGSPWISGANGRANMLGAYVPEGASLDVVVRGEGFASTLERFSGADFESFLAGNEVITVHRGRQVEISFRLPDGLEIPDSLIPEVYFVDHQHRVRPMRQPEMARAYAGRRLPDFNELNVIRASPGRYTFNLAESTQSFSVAIHSPGFLQFFESGPLTWADAPDGILDIEVPRPGVIEIDLVQDAAATGVPLPDALTLQVLWKIPEKKHFYDVAAQPIDGTARPSARLPDLAPGEYEVWLREQPKAANAKGAPSAPERPMFFASRPVVLLAGETQRVEFKLKSFDPNAFRGQRSARIHIANPDGSPAAGRKAVVQYYDESYGYQDMFSGKIPKSGVVELSGLSDKAPERFRLGKMPGTFKVAVDGQDLGYFNLTHDAPNEKFEFHLPLQPGDLVPDFELVNAATGARSRLHDLRGKVVCIELWATWCGPCQPSMHSLNELAGKNRPRWGERVAIIPISVDEHAADAARHAERCGWNNLENYWNGTIDATGYTAPAMQALVVNGIPAAFVIDHRGRIVWRGHPADASHGGDLRRLIDKALSRL